ATIEIHGEFDRRMAELPLVAVGTHQPRQEGVLKGAELAEQGRDGFRRKFRYPLRVLEKVGQSRSQGGFLTWLPTPSSARWQAPGRGARSRGRTAMERRQLIRTVAFWWLQPSRSSRQAGGPLEFDPGCPERLHRKGGECVPWLIPPP
ncbi:MAG: hypothetical protein ACE5K9_08985, partial [Candidatus Methylomirabilales bacterium]